MGSITILNKKTIVIILLFSFFTSTLSAQKENYLKSTHLIKSQLKLTFKYKIDHVKFFTLKGKGGIIKYVYDIKNAVLPKGKSISSYKHIGVTAFRMGQFSKTYLRIVIESKYPNYKTYSVHGKSLILNLPKPKPKKITKYSPIIIVDAGHGGYDIGASYGKIIEKKITISLALKLKRELKKRGYRVFMTRKADEYRSLGERTDYANAKKAKIFISLHTNASPRKKYRNRKYIYKGLEIFYLRGKSRRARYTNRKVYTSRWKKRKSYQLATLIKKEMLKSVRKKYIVLDKGVKRNNFWVLRGTRMPSILIECGYITDRYEGKRLISNYYQNLLVSGIVKGVDSYFNRK